MSAVLSSHPVSRLKIDEEAIARAEAALRSLSSQFAGWLSEELAKLEASRRLLPAGALERTDFNRLYTHAHDLKGLGATYGFPLISRIASSLCRLLDSQRISATTLPLLDAHLSAIHAVVREERRDENDAEGVRWAQTLESGVDRVSEYERGD